MLGIKFLLLGIEISLLGCFWRLNRIAQYYDYLNRQRRKLDETLNVD